MEQTWALLEHLDETVRSGIGARSDLDDLEQQWSQVSKWSSNGGRDQTWMKRSYLDEMEQQWSTRSDLDEMEQQWRTRSDLDEMEQQWWTRSDLDEMEQQWSQVSR